MKKHSRNCLLVLFLFLCGITAHSQVLISLLFGDKLNQDGIEFGLDTGFNWSEISDLESSSSLRTFNLGLYFDIRIKDPWYFYTGALLKYNMGHDELTDEDLAFLGITPFSEEGNYAQRINYIAIPLLARYKFRNRIFLEGGFQVNFKTKAFVEFISETDARDIEVKEFNKGAIKDVDAGLSAGLGYSLSPGKGVSLGLRYYYGLVDVYKDRSGTRNSTWFLRATIPVGAKKAKQRAEDAESSKQ